MLIDIDVKTYSAAITALELVAGLMKNSELASKFSDARVRLVQEFRVTINRLDPEALRSAREGM